MEHNQQAELVRHIFKTMKCIHLELGSCLAKNNIDITPQQYFILNRISKQKTLIQQELANMMKMDKSSMLRQINALQKEMLIARIPDETDKRKKILVLTQKGGDLFKKAEAIGNTFFSDLYEGVSEEDLEPFFRVLNQLKANSIK